MATLVMKFGGSLTADARSLNRVAQVILAEALAWPQMVVVIAAMANTTDQLNGAVDRAVARSGSAYRRIVAEQRARHVAIIEALFPAPARRKHLSDYLDRRLFEVLSVLERVAASREATPRDRDAVMAAGEQVMAHLVTELVQQEGLAAALVDAEQVIITDQNHQNAHPLSDLIEARAESILRPMLEAHIVPLVPGFIGGAARTGTLTTLGRGGSDYTATLLGAALRADEVWMWTNVDGIMSADPNLVPGARVIPSLTYEEVGELSYFGARVLHPGAIEPLINLGIPLRVRNPDNLDHAGTVIQAQADEGSDGLKAVSAVDGLILTSEGQPFDLATFLGSVHQLVGSAATGPVIVTQSHRRAALVFVVPTNEGPAAVEGVAARLAAGLPRWTVQPVKVVAVLGSPGTTSSLGESVSAGVLASALGPGNRRLFAVHPAFVQATVRHLHRLTESTPPSSGVWPRRTVNRT